MLAARRWWQHVTHQQLRSVSRRSAAANGLFWKGFWVPSIKYVNGRLTTTSGFLKSRTKKVEHSDKDAGRRTVPPSASCGRVHSYIISNNWKKTLLLMRKKRAAEEKVPSPRLIGLFRFRKRRRTTSLNTWFLIKNRGRTNRWEWTYHVDICIRWWLRWRLVDSGVSPTVSAVPSVLIWSFAAVSRGLMGPRGRASQVQKPHTPNEILQPACDLDSTGSLSLSLSLSVWSLV